MRVRHNHPPTLITHIKPIAFMYTHKTTNDLDIGHNFSQVSSEGPTGPRYDQYLLSIGTYSDMHNSDETSWVTFKDKQLEVAEIVITNRVAIQPVGGYMAGVISEVNRKVRLGSYMQTVPAKGVAPEHQVQGFDQAYVSGIISFEGDYALITLASLHAGDQHNKNYGFWIKTCDLHIPRSRQQEAKDGLARFPKFIPPYTM
jgi:hypothetical protein